MKIGGNMKVTPYKNVTLEDVAAEGTKAAKIRWLITEKDGAKNFAMRMFEIDKDGYTPYHSHPWEHEVFVLEGEGKLLGDREEYRFEKGYVLFIPSGEPHQFKNTGDGKLKFLCIIPKIGIKDRKS
jgi:quercetin dioxygenase-like cupin family protein